MCIIPIFWRFKDKSFTVVSSIIMKEDSYSEPAIRRVEMPCSPEHTKPLETRLFYRTTPIFLLLCTNHLQPYPAFMHRSFAKLLPWFYILGAQKNRLIEMVLHMFYLKTFKAYIPISFLRFQRCKLYSGITRFLEFV